MNEKLKRVVDILMTAALLFLMGYQLWGEKVHEWVGAGIFILFAAHHGLNWRWYKNILRGKYPPVRIFQVCVDFLTMLSMLILMYSGIVLSRHVFSFLPIESGIALARRLHILGSYWGFLLMSLHLGLHWNMILGILKKKRRIKKVSKIRSTVCFVAGVLVAGYGGYVFIKRDFITYLFLKTEFVFLDYSELPMLFYIDYIALMGLCIFVAYYIVKLCSKIPSAKAVNHDGRQAEN